MFQMFVIVIVHWQLARYTVAVVVAIGVLNTHSIINEGRKFQNNATRKTHANAIFTVAVPRLPFIIYKNFAV